MKLNSNSKLCLAAARRAALCLALPLALAATPVSAEEDESNGGVVIKDFVLTRAIEQREPIDMVEDFTLSDDTGYAFFRVFNDGPPTRMTAVWMYQGQVHAHVPLTIGTAEGWRTWTSANLKPGDWSVQLRDTSGTVLAERSFAVVSEFADTDPRSAPMSSMAPAGRRFDDGMSQQAEDWPVLEGSDYPSFGQKGPDG